ncbi:MAG TPA: hypothetical protein VFD62_09470 [Pyrinomonadaceae bacterium]|nr:hypothetical protein [Pyrinomonadaceae bacterium]
MSVDPAGHHRQAAQVVVDWIRLGIDSDDLRALDDDSCVSENVSFAVEQSADGDYDAFRLGQCCVAASDYNEQQDDRGPCKLTTGHSVYFC